MATRLEQATKRLEQAVAGLESALRTRANGNGRGHGEPASDAVRRAQSDYAALKEVTETVSVRLDDAIDRLKGALDA